MYDLEIKDEADRIFWKLAKRDQRLLRIINNKLDEIRANPQHGYKFLRKPLQNFNRVHINSHFVLVFRIDHMRETIEVWYFDHHDNVYKWRPFPRKP